MLAPSNPMRAPPASKGSPSAEDLRPARPKPMTIELPGRMSNADLRAFSGDASPTQTRACRAELWSDQRRCRALACLQPRGSPRGRARRASVQRLGAARRRRRPPSCRGHGRCAQVARILAVDADEDDQPGVGVAVASFYIPGIEPGQVGIEIAGCWIWVCPGIYVHQLAFRSLRSACVEVGPVTISQMVGSTVDSITSVSVAIPGHLLGLLRRDPTCPELVKRYIGGQQQLTDHVAGHSLGLPPASDGPNKDTASHRGLASQLRPVAGTHPAEDDGIPRK